MELLLQGEFLTYTIITILAVSAIIYLSGPRVLYVILALCVLIDVNIYYLKGIFDLGLLKVALFFPYFLFYGWKFRFTNPPGMFLLLWLAFTFPLIFLATEPAVSFSSYAKMAIGMLMFPAAMLVVRREEDMYTIGKVVVAVVLLLLINMIVAQFVDLGLENVYLENDATAIRFGGGVAQLSYLLVFSLLVSPLLYDRWGKTAGGKFFVTLLMVIAAVVILLYLRRMSILAAFLGVSFILLKLDKKELMVKLYFVGTIALVAVLITFMGDIAEILAVRFQDVAEGEGRFLELALIIADYFGESVKHTLIGSEFLNSAGYYYSYFGYGRQIHTDFGQVFHGSGLIGLLIYVGIFVSLILYRNYLKEKIPAAVWPQREDVIFFALLIAHFFISFSGSLTFLTYQAFLFFMLGAVVKVYQLRYRQSVEEAGR